MDAISEPGIEDVGGGDIRAEMRADAAEKQAASGVCTRNGKVRFFTLGDLDRRTAAYRMTVELIERVEADLGGADQLSTAEQQIIRHAALTGTMLEDLGTRWLNGEKVDPALFATLSNSERRLYETVGLRRRPRDVTPDLRTYVADSLHDQGEAA